MPTLLEVQTALCASLLDRRAGAEAAILEPRHRPRLGIYRNTLVSTLTKALRLNFPAVHRLVGDDFFAAAAERFIEESPPRCADLDRYGAEFPDFLHAFSPAGGLPYLADVARLEWAVSTALHAADAEPLDCMKLIALASADQANLCFMPHPSVSLVRAAFPADAIWRAVLNRDDAALAALDPGTGPAHLLVARDDDGVSLERLEEAAWRFAADLCAGRPLQAALDAAVGVDATALLAGHLSAGRFIGCQIGRTP